MGCGGEWLIQRGTRRRRRCGCVACEKVKVDGSCAASSSPPPPPPPPPPPALPLLEKPDDPTPCPPATAPRRPLLARPDRLYRPCRPRRAGPQGHALALSSRSRAAGEACVCRAGQRRGVFSCGLEESVGASRPLAACRPMRHLATAPPCLSIAGPSARSPAGARLQEDGCKSGGGDLEHGAGHGNRARILTAAGDLEDGAEAAERGGLAAGGVDVAVGVEQAVELAHPLHQPRHSLHLLLLERPPQPPLRHPALAHPVGPVAARARPADGLQGARAERVEARGVALPGREGRGGQGRGPGSAGRRGDGAGDDSESFLGPTLRAWRLLTRPASVAQGGDGGRGSDGGIGTRGTRADGGSVGGPRAAPGVGRGRAEDGGCCYVAWAQGRTAVGAG